ncbi:MAG: hypothetical protein HOC70_17320 [Gammaproteobacteria bacterium]|jgi:DNA mismatch repair protein MutS|nr:hypothetical protein [Gammaproteobacteria bacterium]
MSLLSKSLTESDVMILDAQTLKDLDIFDSNDVEESLYAFCNLTQTEGGAKVLRRRMERPWSEASLIRATQESLSFILSNRQIFTKLPSAYITSRTERYTSDVLPLVTQDSLVEFSLSAFSLWANQDSHYASIVRGVQITSRFIWALQQFLSQPELASSLGELTPLVEEMRTLIAHPKISLASHQPKKSWAWKTLRLDQVFRLHEKEALSRLLQLIFEIDALVAMADVTRNKGFVLPEIQEGSLRVSAEGLVHPFLEKAVANSVELDQRRRLLFLTGPNMAGKTTYLRTFATALYLAHLGMGVPASSFRFVPANRLFSSISLTDDLRSGISYFRAEALRIKAIAHAVAEGHRVIAVMDEPFKGTNVKDAYDASLAILERLAIREDCLFVFSSHLIELSEHLSSSKEIVCCYFEAKEGEGRLRFDYKLRSGVSDQRLGMRVLQEEGVFELLDSP